MAHDDYPEPTIIQVTVEITAGELSAITDLYNRSFPQALHETRYKRHMYQKASAAPIVLVIWDGIRPVGLLESWHTTKRPGCRLLTTLVVDPDERGRGLARRMVEKLVKLTEAERRRFPLAVNYRAQNRERLEPFYERFGFSDPAVVGVYANGDEMWEMRRWK